MVKAYEATKETDPFALHPDEARDILRSGSPWFYLKDLGWTMDADYERSYFPRNNILILRAPAATHKRLVNFHIAIGLPIVVAESSKLPVPLIAP